MTGTRGPRKRGWPGLLGGLLLCAPPAAAADPPCLGRWRLEPIVTLPTSDDWLPPDSWCRSRNLPPAFEVSIRRMDNGSIDLSGTPFRPADVLVSGGRCEVELDGKDSGLPEANGLSFELAGGEPASFGKGKCAQRGPWQAGGLRTGVSIGVLVKATRLDERAATTAPSTSPPASADASGEGFRMLMPLAFTTHEETVALPWGRATELVRIGADPFTNTTYLFGTHVWSRAPAKLDQPGLRKLRAAFVKNRGCRAHDLRQAPLADAQGRAWPQTIFAGACEGGDSFQVAFVLAGRALYHFQAVQQASVVRRATLPLDEALARLVGSFNLVE